MLTFTNLVLWLHLIALIIWIGAVFFMTLVLFPPLRNYTASPKHFALISFSLLKRLRTITWELIGLIVLTGLFNLIIAGLRRDFQFSDSYLYSLGVKVLLLAVMIATQLLQLGVFWPRLIRLCEDQDSWLPPPESFNQNRRRLNGLAFVFLLAGALAVFVGLGLRRV